jgi:hypothetical protein
MSKSKYHTVPERSFTVTHNKGKPMVGDRNKRKQVRKEMAEAAGFKKADKKAISVVRKLQSAIKQKS